MRVNDGGGRWGGGGRIVLAGGGAGGGRVLMVFMQGMYVGAALCKQKCRDVTHVVCTHRDL
jgi:hypothetical protein